MPAPKVVRSVDPVDRIVHWRAFASGYEPRLRERAAGISPTMRGELRVPVGRLPPALSSARELERRDPYIEKQLLSRESREDKSKKVVTVATIGDQLLRISSIQW